MKTLSTLKLFAFALVFATGMIYPESKLLSAAPEPVGGASVVAQNVVYPELAQRFRIEGEVDVQVTVDQDGNVADAKVIKGIGFGCDEAALKAVKATKFNPIISGDEKVTTQLTLPIVFKIKK